MDSAFSDQYWMGDWRPEVTYVEAEPAQQYLQQQITPPQTTRTARPLPSSGTDTLPSRELVLRQAPLQARAASGRAKSRKPVDPPPVVQLIDRRRGGRQGLYDSPYIFLYCSLVPENYDERTRSPELPMDCLTGTRTSSIYHLRDKSNEDGGFFIFGDLSVREEGRFKLRFTLYEREAKPDGQYDFVSELVTDSFVVYAPKMFPGMMESTNLTRVFSDQGVKLRLRKEVRAPPSRNRKRAADESFMSAARSELQAPSSKRLTLSDQTSVGDYESPSRSMPFKGTESEVQDDGGTRTMESGASKEQAESMHTGQSTSSNAYYYQLPQETFFQHLPE